MSTDHLRGSEITAALKRAEAAERETAKFRYLYERDTTTVIALFVAAIVAACMALWMAEITRDAITARDAAQSQAQLYLDGWRECVKAREGKTPKVKREDESGTCYQFTDGEACYGDGDAPTFRLSSGQILGPAVRYDTSLLDPARRIDR